jgi:RimJ/RimL family protein N-acetyltransferase
VAAIIREATPEDAERLGPLLAALGYPADPPTIRRRVGHLRATDRSGRVLLAVENGAVLGFITLHGTPVLHRPTDVGRITALAVAPEGRGRGIGRLLVEAAERSFVAAGLSRVEVTSGAGHRPAHDFYRHLGYEDAGIRLVRPLPDTAGAPSPARQPTLATERLILRPFRLDDASEVQRLAGAAQVADTALNIPHPYLDGMAEAWIATHESAFDRGDLVVFAIALAAGPLVGAISLRLEPDHGRAELGYWVGVPYWGRGYATEAGRAVIGYGFDVLGLNRIHAAHLVRNPASGRVMVKLGMLREGTHRQHVRKDGRFEDLDRWAILRTDSRGSGA